MAQSSGLTDFTLSVINQTAAQAANTVLSPQSTGLLGTPQVNTGNNAYAMVYGYGSEILASPGAIPAQNRYMAVAATAPSSGSNTVNGIAMYGSAQGNAKNPCAGNDVAIPAEFALIYAELKRMADLSYAI